MMGISALEKLVDDISDNRAPESELGLVSLRIHAFELIEMSGDELVERRLTGTARFVEGELARRTNTSHGVVECIGRAVT